MGFPGELPGERPESEVQGHLRIDATEGADRPDSTASIAAGVGQTAQDQVLLNPVVRGPQVAGDVLGPAWFQQSTCFDWRGVARSVPQREGTDREVHGLAVVEPPEAESLDEGREVGHELDDPMAGADDLRSEYVVKVTGTVRLRPEGTTNPELATGETFPAARLTLKAKEALALFPKKHAA